MGRSRAASRAGRPVTGPRDCAPGSRERGAPGPECACVLTCQLARPPARPLQWPGGGRSALGAFATVPCRDSVGGSLGASLSVTGVPHARVTRGLSPGCAKSWAPPQSGSGAGERRARVSEGRVMRARGQGRQAAGAWEEKAGWAGWGMAGEVTQSRRPTGPWKAGRGGRGERATPDGLARSGTGRGCRDAREAPRGRARLLVPPGRGLTADGGGKPHPALGESGGAPSQAAVQTGGGGPTPTPGRRAGGVVHCGRAGPRGAGCASLLSARRRNLLQQTGDRGCP